MTIRLEDELNKSKKSKVIEIAETAGSYVLTAGFLAGLTLGVGLAGAALITGDAIGYIFNRNQRSEDKTRQAYVESNRQEARNKVYAQIHLDAVNRPRENLQNMAEKSNPYQNTNYPSENESYQVDKWGIRQPNVNLYSQNNSKGRFNYGLQSGDYESDKYNQKDKEHPRGNFFDGSFDI